MKTVYYSSYRFKFIENRSVLFYRGFHLPIAAAFYMTKLIDVKSLRR